MHVCMCVCVCVATHTHIHTYTHTHIHTNKQTCMHTCIHAYIHTYIPIYICIYMVGFQDLYVHINILYACVSVETDPRSRSIYTYFTKNSIYLKMLQSDIFRYIDTS